MQYDGTSKLGEAIAALYGCSPRNHNKVAELIQQAKDDLGITTKAKILPDEVKLTIWQWHYERLNPVQDAKQDESVHGDDIQSSDDTIIQDVKRNDDDKPDLLSDSIVCHVKQTDSVQDIKPDMPIQYDDDIDSAIYDFKQIHFAVTFPHQGQLKRTTVMLEGYLVKALQRKHGLTDNAAIRAWLEQAIKSDGARFDSFAPLTRQVKRAIVESFV